MDPLYLRPDQIIAMVDCPPLHSPEALDRYYRRFRADADDISPVPVMGTDLVLGAFRHQPDRYASYGQILEAFLADHPSATHFMLEGFHRGAAAVLAGRLIPCVEIRTDADFAEINASGRAINLHGDYTTITRAMVSVAEELQELEAHFCQHRRFWTVAEKVRAMVANGDVPQSGSEEENGRSHVVAPQVPGTAGCRPAP